MGEVVIANIDTTLPLPLKRILDGAQKAELTEVVVIGWLPDGQLYLAATHGDLGGHLILLERAKATVLDQRNG
jgi:hypothetical protein